MATPGNTVADRRRISEILDGLAIRLTADTKKRMSLREISVSLTCWGTRTRT